MHFYRRIVVSLLFPALLPVLAQVQGPIPPPSIPAQPASSYQNSADGLRWQLQDILNVAREPNGPKLESLIRQMEIPNYEDWFTKTYGEERGARMTGVYERSLPIRENEMVTIFTQLAGEDGEFIPRKAVDSQAWLTTPGVNDPPAKGQRDPANPYLVFWHTRGSANLGGHPVGTFVYVDGGFRLLSIFKSPSFAPGTSTYPNLGPVSSPGNNADTANAPSGSGSKTDAGRIATRAATYPTCVYCPSAEYSDAARKKRLQGTVVLQVTVQPDGSATDIQAVESPDPELTKMAMDSVRKWRFNPALNRDGDAVPTKVPIEVTFRLSK